MLLLSFTNSLFLWMKEKKIMQADLWPYGVCVKKWRERTGMYVCMYVIIFFIVAGM